MFNKYSGGGAVSDEFKKEIDDLGGRFDLAFKVINAKLTKKELQELYYESIKLIFADGELDDNEKTVFAIIGLRIDLSEEEKRLQLINI